VEILQCADCGMTGCRDARIGKCTLAAQQNNAGGREEKKRFDFHSHHPCQAVKLQYYLVTGWFLADTKL